MKIKYLGTAAAEGMPAVFCDCENCRKAKTLCEKDIRTRSQAIIDGKILIDFPPDSYFHALKYGIYLGDIKACLVTHSHADHFYADDLYMRCSKYAKVPDNNTPLCIYSDKSAFDITNDLINKKEISPKVLTAQLVKPLEEFECVGYKIMPLRALHDKSTTPLLYIIEKDNKSIFYANDTSGIDDEGFEYLKTLENPLSLVSFDCTFANNPEYKEGRHMNLLKCAVEKARLLDIGAADNKTVFILNHFSHNGKDVLYDDFSQIAKGYGFLVSFTEWKLRFDFMRYYPLLLKSKTKDYLWGGTRLATEFGFEMIGDKCAEAWVLSCHKDGESSVVNGEMSGKTLTETLSLWGKVALGKKCERFEYFPILVKLIDAKDKLSVQVHPNDEFALSNEGEYGKTEMWYILDAKEDSKLIFGFDKDVTKEQFENSIKDGTLLSNCKTVNVKKGDVFFIAPGTLHAIGEGILLCEVQQNSNTTYRVFDYDRVGADGKKRDLHIEKALKVTNTNKNDISDFSGGKVQNFDGYQVKNLASCEYFDVCDMKIESKVEIFEQDTFVSLVVTQGNLSLTSENACFDVKPGDSVFVPAGVKCTLSGNANVVVSKI